MKNKNLFFGSFIFFLLVLAGMLWSEKQAQCGSSIIIPLELADSIASFKALLLSTCNLQWIERNTYLDFVFILSYTLTLFFGLRTLTEHLQLADVFKPLIWLVVLPALFDAVENVLLIKFLYADAATVTDSAYSLYYWCVHIKFAMLAVTLVILMVLVAKTSYLRFSPKADKK